LEHQKAENNITADALSRLCTIIKQPNNQFFDIQEVIAAQKACRTELLKEKGNKIIPFEDNEIIHDNKDRIIIPESIACKTILQLHQNLSHPGSTKLFETIKNNLNIKNMINKIIQVYNECIVCAKNKLSTKKYGIVKGGLFQRTTLNSLQ
jgi:hypothetical protein